jgi:predicted kinase
VETLFLTCGLPGSRETTVARRLAPEYRAVGLAPDEWVLRIGSGGYEAATRAAVEAIQWELTQQILVLGVSVILEPGFWAARRERPEFRARGAELGADSRLIFLDVSRDELARRIARRNASVPAGSFVVDEAHLDGWIALFEPPTPDELAE